MTGITSIASTGLAAEISPLGAQLMRLRDAERRDLQWGGDPAVWKGRAPILFPIVGALAGGQYRLGETRYPLFRHGFARDRLFTLVEADAGRALFRLAWDDETLGLYPFRFVLTMAFALVETTLTITATVQNQDTQPLPASFGFHPAFAWPLPYGQPRAAHRIVFERDEAAPVRRIDRDGLLLPQSFATPVNGRTLALRDDLFTNDVLILDRPASRRLVYGAPQGPQLAIAFPQAGQLGLWTKPGAGFICIEPWNGFADPQGFTGDFRDKPGSFHLPPGGETSFTLSITLLPEPRG